MPHISENEVEKLRQAIQAARISPATVNTINMLDHAQDIVKGIHPAPQSDEVRMAWQYVDAFVSCSKKNNNHDAAVHKEITDALALIRVAQSAPVDLERVRELVSRGKMLQETAWMDVEPMPCEVEAQSCFEQALALLPPKESK